MGKEIEIFIEASEQLQAIKQALTDQQSSSDRLRQLVDTVDLLANQVAKVPVGLSAVLDRAKLVQQDVVAAADKMSALRDQIPLIVDRIEKTDVGRSLDSVASGISESKKAVTELQNTISSIGDVVRQFGFAKDAFLKELEVQRAKSEEVQSRLHSSVNALRHELLERIDKFEPTIKNTESICERSRPVGTGPA